MRKARRTYPYTVLSGRQGSSILPDQVKCPDALLSLEDKRFLKNEMVPVEPLDLNGVTLPGGSVPEPESQLTDSVMKGIAHSDRSEVLVQPLANGSIEKRRRGGHV